jgi:hypothetical protein
MVWPRSEQVIYASVDPQHCKIKLNAKSKVTLDVLENDSLTNIQQEKAIKYRYINAGCD